MTNSIEQLIKEANGRLKAGRCGLTIQLLRNRLFLQGILPPKPTSDRASKHQQRIPTGYLGNPAGIQRAEADARIIAGQLVKEQFDWTNHVKIVTVDTTTAAVLIEKFKADYCTRHSLTSFNNYWGSAYKWLPQDEPITQKTVYAALQRHSKETRSRQIAWIGLGLLLRFSKLDIDIESYRSTYTTASLKSKTIPTDAEIFDWHEKIKLQHWRYAYGFFATYGIRNHEIYHLEFEFPNIRVVEGKTNNANKTRLVYPVHPEWFDAFDLKNAVLPTTKVTDHKKEGAAVGYYFRQLAGLPFSIYSLRHAWAIRNIGYGISDTISAKAMGHSIDVHTESYQRWMSDRDTEAAVQRAFSSPNRPMPPCIP